MEAARAITPASLLEVEAAAATNRRANPVFRNATLSAILDRACSRAPATSAATRPGRSFPASRISLDISAGCRLISQAIGGDSFRMVREDVRVNV
jgi:hypothetical protein